MAASSLGASWATPTRHRSISAASYLKRQVGRWRKTTRFKGNFLKALEIQHTTPGSPRILS
jgi:hypothetical protein